MMMGEDSPGVGPLVEEDGNATTPAGSPVPVPVSAPSSFSPSPEAPSPVVSGAGEEVAAAGDEVVPMDEGQLASVAPNGGASAMSNNVSLQFFILLELLIFRYSFSDGFFQCERD